MCQVTLTCYFSCCCTFCVFSLEDLRHGDACVIFAKDWDTLCCLGSSSFSVLQGEQSMQESQQLFYSLQFSSVTGVSSLLIHFDNLPRKLGVLEICISTGCKDAT